MARVNILYLPLLNQASLITLTILHELYNFMLNTFVSKKSKSFIGVTSLLANPKKIDSFQSTAAPSSGKFTNE